MGLTETLEPGAGAGTAKTRLCCKQGQGRPAKSGYRSQKLPLEGTVNVWVGDADAKADCNARKGLENCNEKAMGAVVFTCLQERKQAPGAAALLNLNPLKQTKLLFRCGAPPFLTGPAAAKTLYNFTSKFSVLDEPSHSRASKHHWSPRGTPVGDMGAGASVESPPCVRHRKALPTETFQNSPPRLHAGHVIQAAAR